jgi:hypothetical protein
VGSTNINIRNNNNSRCRNMGMGTVLDLGQGSNMVEDPWVSFPTTLMDIIRRDSRDSPSNHIIHLRWVGWHRRRQGIRQRTNKIYSS